MNMTLSAASGRLVLNQRANINERVCWETRDGYLEQT